MDSTTGVHVAILPIEDSLASSELAKHFANKFNASPAFFVRVPGRVNLIGEHIDYCGYPVLPMALEQDVILAVGLVDEPMIFLTNLDAQYEYFEDTFNNFSRKEGKRPAWYEYVLCGVVGVSGLAGAETRGLRLAVSSSVPPAAGLSSSSALVCAAALAMAHACQLKLTKMEMAKLCAKSERLIGTEGGGMDQAIAFLAEQGCAQYISWNPLRAAPVTLPQGAVFVVAHSLVEANKAATHDYNDRVKDCKLAARKMLIDAGIDVGKKELTLSESQLLLGADLKAMLARAAKLPHTVEQFKPRDRAMHVFSEALRVEQFRELCNNGTTLGEELRPLLGRLMRDSHSSLQELYECSHPALDQLVSLSDAFGVDARLTGAGWGGCIVALCASDKAEDYVRMLKEKFYQCNPAAKGRDLSSLVFITKPQRGACIYQNTSINYKH